MPPKPAAEVASLTFIPDLVGSPLPPFSGGAHAASAATTSPDAAVAARSRNAFMGETFRWAGEWPGYPTVYTLPGRDTRLQGRRRVSTTDRNPQLQLNALRDAGAIRIFNDHGVGGFHGLPPRA